MPGEARAASTIVAAASARAASASRRSSVSRWAATISRSRAGSVSGYFQSVSTQAATDARAIDSGFLLRSRASSAVARRV